MKSLLRLSASAALLLSMIFPARFAVAQTPEWQVISTANANLPTTEFISVAIDRSGNKWFGTPKGVARYDGTSWTYFDSTTTPFLHNHVTSISVDESGLVYVSTRGGLATFDGTTWSPYARKEVANVPVYGQVTDVGGARWLSTSGHQIGLVKIAGDSMTNHPIEWTGLMAGTADHLARDSSGGIWIAVLFRGVSRFNGTYWTPYTTAGDILPDDYIMDIQVDRKGKVFIGTADKGYATFEDGIWRHYNTNNSGIYSNRIGVMAFDPQNRMWIGNNDGNTGIMMFDGTTWTRFTPRNSGLPSTDVFSFAFDSLGNTWAVTPNGIAVYRKGGVLGVERDHRGVAAEASVSIEPNPVSAAATISVDLRGLAGTRLPVEIELVDIMGRSVAMLEHGEREPGLFTLQLDASRFSAGTYFCSVRAGATRRVLPLILSAR